MSLPERIEMENHAAEVKLAERRNEQRLEALDIRQYRAVYWTRLALRVLSMLLCALIIMSLVDVTRTYEKTKHLTDPFKEGSGSIPVWPLGLKLYPSYVLLGAAVVAGFFSFVLVLASFVKSVRIGMWFGRVAADEFLDPQNDQDGQYSHSSRIVDLPCSLGFRDGMV